MQSYYSFSKFRSKKKRRKKKSTDKLRRQLLSALSKRQRRKQKIKALQIFLLKYASGFRRKPKKKSSGILNSSKYFPSSKRRLERSPIPTSLTIEHILNCSSKLGVDYDLAFSASKTIKVPENFSLVNSPKDTYDFIASVFWIVYNDLCAFLNVDYQDCKHIDLDAQVFMDVLLKEAFKHSRNKQGRKIPVRLQKMGPINFEKDHIEKVLFSIGSFKIHAGIQKKYSDIVPFNLVTGTKYKPNTKGQRVSIQKEIHTTKLIDYVIASLKMMGREFKPTSRNQLCQVAGEVIINAEEHGTTDHWYSIGFFQDIRDGKSHFGEFNLVIFNIGKTIYEKFKDPNCPTQHIVSRMKSLSEKYTKKGFFSPAKFEEETLWTLYALQEGITTKINYKKRGNGCIRFINSFEELKGTGVLTDNISKMVILSGNTQIIFDGSYSLANKTVGESKFKVMTFNQSGDIENQPDNNFVKFADHYFPGTMIVAKIRIGEEDLQPDQK